MKHSKRKYIIEGSIVLTLIYFVFVTKTPATEIIEIDRTDTTNTENSIKIMKENTLSNTGSSNDQFVNTENQNTAEILVDTGKKIPTPDIEQKAFKQIDEQSGQNIGEDTEQIEIPSEINLEMVFYPQAPDADRSLPRKEACEEASIILAANYLKGNKLTKQQFKEDVLTMVEIQQNMFGDYIDTSIKQTAELYDKYFDIGQTKIINNPTINQMKAELAQGHPIVAPFAGRELGNSYYTDGGPRYHMLVIRGYDQKYFYTNDVGTRRGENFPYTYDTIINAMHDLTEGDITQGQKRILVIEN